MHSAYGLSLVSMHGIKFTWGILFPYYGVECHIIYLICKENVDEACAVYPENRLYISEGRTFLKQVKAMKLLETHLAFFFFFFATVSVDRRSRAW